MMALAGILMTSAGNTSLKPVIGSKSLGGVKTRSVQHHRPHFLRRSTLRSSMHFMCMTITPLPLLEKLKAVQLIAYL